MRNSFGYVAVIALVAAGAGHAQSITVGRVVVNGQPGRRVNQGGTIHVEAAWAAEGQTPNMKAELDGKVVTVSEAADKYVGVQIPDDQPVGKAKLKLTARGKGEATVDIEIVDRKNPIGGDEGRGGAVTGQPDPADLARASFEITKLTLVSTPAGKQIEAEGKAPRLPDGFNVVLSIGLDGGPAMEPRQTQVTAGAWKVTFGPWTTEVPFGAWRAKLGFELSKQGKLQAKRFTAKLPENERTAFDYIERQEVLIVGTDEEKAAQTKELKAHAKTLVTLARQLFDEVDKAYASGGRCFFRGAGGANQDAKWEAWVQDQKLIPATPEGLVAARNDTRFARGGHFQTVPWTTWATDKLLTPLQTARQQREDFGKRWFTPPDPKVEAMGSELLTMVGERLRNTGQLMFENAKSTMPQSVIDLLPTTSAGGDAVSRVAFEAKCRLLLRTVGESVPD